MAVIGIHEGKDGYYNRNVVSQTKEDRMWNRGVMKEYGVHYSYLSEAGNLVLKRCVLYYKRDHQVLLFVGNGAYISATHSPRNALSINSFCGTKGKSPLFLFSEHTEGCPWL